MAKRQNKKKKFTIGKKSETGEQTQKVRDLRSLVGDLSLIN
jgi:hypothetical protein